ncbi:MAG TPA: hypothetical protein GX721_00795 [Firmicutes bacterium]|nr:hypothetical protein [Bacillota bacterium]
MESVVEDYVEKMRQDYGMIGAMVTGSHVAGNIQKAAVDIFENYDPELDMRERTDYSFYVETIMKDGIDVSVMTSREELLNIPVIV